jgi:hypothetical protein
MDFVVIQKRKKSLKPSDLSSNDEKSIVAHKDLVCTVCGAPATGFNFAVITCMCCKAFFRRNALLGLSALQCRYSSDSCVINLKTRRDCSYCRLQKCFQVGMKKELILTEDLKRIKREKILANRQMTLNTIRSIDTLSIKKTPIQLKDLDLNYLSNIHNAYENYCRLPLISFEQQEYEALSQQPIKSRIKIQHYFQYFGKYETTLISFFKCLPEFKQFSDDEQLTLSKHNMRFLVRISLIEIIDDQLPIWPSINLLLQTIFGKLLMDQTNDLLHNFKCEINDSTCIRLLLIILLFSTYNTYNGQTEPLKIYKIQEKYIELLWSYLEQYYGEFQARQKMSIITRYCLHLQTIGHFAELKRQELEHQNYFLALE